jgi:hypothetical protein
VNLRCPIHRPPAPSSFCGAPGAFGGVSGEDRPERLLLGRSTAPANSPETFNITETLEAFESVGVLASEHQAQVGTASKEKEPPRWNVATLDSPGCSNITRS